jgi:hypothetical protein
LTRWLLGVRTLQQTAAAKDDAGGDGGGAAGQEITARSHDFLPVF